MPRESILKGLVALANEYMVTALFWHVVLAAALGWLASSARRPPRAVVGLLLVMPVVSAATLALLNGQGFNGLALTLLLGLLVATAVKLPALPVERARGVRRWLGWAFVAFAAVYPHFVHVTAVWQYAFFAPLGVLPCPTLALLLGTSLLTSGLNSRAWSLTVATFAFAYGALGSFGLGVWLDLPLVLGALALLTSGVRHVSHGSRPSALPTLVALVLALGAEQLRTPTQAQPVERALKHTDAALAQAREDEKLADDVELAFSQRWPNIAEIVHDAALPVASTEDVLRARGLPDLEAGLPTGVFSGTEVRRRYFAALWLGWQTEANAVAIVARLEAARLASLLAARAELPDVEQRLVLDGVALAASDRLHAFCQRLSALGSSCSDVLVRRNVFAPFG